MLALALLGVTAAATPADAVIAAALPGLSPGAVLIDHTTTLPVLTAARAARLQVQGLPYLHCPVFMGPPSTSC